MSINHDFVPAESGEDRCGFCIDPMWNSPVYCRQPRVAHVEGKPATEALPPLPDDWEPVGTNEHRWKFNGNRVYVSPEGSAHVEEGWYRPADLITVLRHAQAAQARLKEQANVR